MGFLLDTSSSILGSPTIIVNIQDFVTRIIARLVIGRAASYVGVVQFASDQQIIFDFSTYYTKYDMYDAVYGISPLTTNTNTSGGLK